MKGAQRRPITLAIVAADPPFTRGDGVLFGLQSGTEVENPVPACATAQFQTVIDVVGTGNPELDFTGGHVHGRRGDRFIYLVWGFASPTEPFVMFARAKIKLNGVPGDLLAAAADRGEVLIAELEATNTRSEPASGTIKPPAIGWQIR